MKDVKKVIDLIFPFLDFDAVAVGVIDFKSMTFETHESFNHVPSEHYYFDLASLTKVLTNSLSYFLKPESFTPEALLCLSHRGGLPAWGLLPREGWEEIIRSYKIEDSATLYSDFSALRVMLELQDKKIDQKNLCSKTWDKELLHWKELSWDAPLLQTGFKESLPNFGKVHDPNAYVINSFCSHAGLFSTIKGLCQTLINYERETSFIEKVSHDLGTHKNRFSYGWDRVENFNDPLAGKNCGSKTFGHLGFTGTSIWIDPDKKLGHVILTNAVKDYWFHKEGLNELRRAVGECVWRLH